MWDRWKEASMLKTSSIRSVISIQYRVVTDRKTERYTMTMPLESDRLPRQRYLSDSLSFFHSSITMNHFHNLTQYCTIVCYEELANNKWFTFCIQHNITISGWPSVIWHCWLSGRKGIQPVKKNRVVGCWHGYLSEARCRLAYCSADVTATHCLLLQ